MTARGFVDTNIFLYAASKHPDDAVKKKVARALIASEDLGISAQVLQEFIAAAAKQRLGIDDSETKAVLDELLSFPIVPITGELVVRAFEIKTRYQISYWDAAIVAAAEELQCEVIFSEDLSAGQRYCGILVTNPFAQKSPR